jgi:DNA-binding transcriptional regulator of glucitol operon
LAAFAQRATVIVVVDETECIEGHPKMKGLNILRFP